MIIKTIDIDSMTAGRELDALVAEKVMDWDVVIRGETTVGLNSQEVWLGSAPDNKSIIHTDILHYSTNISDAWQVVEKIDVKHFSFQLTSHDGTGAEVGYYMFQWFSGNNSGKLIAEAEEDTIPLAICKSSLKSALAKQH